MVLFTLLRTVRKVSGTYTRGTLGSEQNVSVGEGYSRPAPRYTQFASAFPPPCLFDFSFSWGDACLNREPAWSHCYAQQIIAVNLLYSRCRIGI